MMSKLTTPKAILIGSFMIALAVLFRVDGAVITKANAHVAGMSHKDLSRDRDFIKAVASIVENCSITGYVENSYLHTSNISC